MRIAIIGWGSLIWDPRELPREGRWQVGGPELPIEFSRVSQDCRLTLVIDQRVKRNSPTRYAMSPRTDVDDVVNDLKKREGTGEKFIGYIDTKRRTNSRDKYPTQVGVHEEIGTWCRAKGFGAAVWAALPFNFENETNQDFTLDNAVEYLRHLPEAARKNALKYITCAPEEVETPLRTKLRQLGMIE